MFSNEMKYNVSQQFQSSLLSQKHFNDLLQASVYKHLNCQMNSVGMSIYSTHLIQY